MIVAALYDIHGNLPALEAVLAEVGRTEAETILVGGDVMPGPMCPEAMALLREQELPVLYIRGNGDREVLAIRAGGEGGNFPASVREVMHWVAGALTPEQARLAATWPETVTIDVDGLGPVLFCHATPRDDNEIFTRLTPEERVEPALAGVGPKLVVCGHTHMQFDRKIGPKRVVNAGSVGMPFGEPGAYWMLLGPKVELRRTEYDLEAAATRIRATEYPQSEEFARGNVLDPPTEADMTELLEAGAMGG